MDIVKVATEWAKAEVISAKVFIFFGIIFIITSIGFWQLGKTELSKAFIFPTLIAGTLLLAAGGGFYFGNTSRVSNFETEYKTDPHSFVQSEIDRTQQTINTYKNVAFKVFPGIIALAAILMIFVDRPLWRAIFITVMAFLIVMLFIDIHANDRMKEYHNQLVIEENRLK